MSESPVKREEVSPHGETPYGNEARFGEILLASLRAAAARECGFDRQRVQDGIPKANEEGQPKLEDN